MSVQWQNVLRAYTPCKIAMHRLICSQIIMTVIECIHFRDLLTVVVLHSTSSYIHTTYPTSCATLPHNASRSVN